MEDRCPNASVRSVQRAIDRAHHVSRDHFRWKVAVTAAPLKRWPSTDRNLIPHGGRAGQVVVHGREMLQGSTAILHVSSVVKMGGCEGLAGNQGVTTRRRHTSLRPNNTQPPLVRYHGGGTVGH